MSTTQKQTQDLLRQLPQVEKLLRSPAAKVLSPHPRPEVLRALRETLDGLRSEILSLGTTSAGDAGSNGSDGHASGRDGLAEKLAPAALVAAAANRLEQRARPHYRKVINASGIILHTGLGRAVLAPAALEALQEALDGYSLVEVDSTTGERNRREGFVAELICELTGAESATVVNNNAAATLIVLAALARGREVIISRGQLVEIGGSFRIPTVMEESGAHLVEVGTTNRTYIDDYRSAIGPETAMLLQVHTSNYEIHGFVHHTPLDDLVALGREKNVVVVSDVGSGCFVDLSRHGFRREPLVEDSVAAGADVVCFSGDKLLGGPQAGIIVGTKAAVDTIRRHALFRAMRVDKMTLAALEATLRLYRDPDNLAGSLPTLNMISQPDDQIRRRAETFATALRTDLDAVSIDVIPSQAQTGSGSLPTQEIPSWAVALDAARMRADELVTSLRTAEPPVFARVQENRVLLDFRTIRSGEEQQLREILREILVGKPQPRG